VPRGPQETVTWLIVVVNEEMFGERLRRGWPESDRKTENQTEVQTKRVGRATDLRNGSRAIGAIGRRVGTSER